MRLTIIRHGITSGNILNQHIGTTDIPLAAEGEELARKTSKFLGKYDAYYCSPMLRTRQTAALLFPGKTVTPFDGFQERDFGEYEGKTHTELAGDPFYAEWVQDQISAPPGGESVDMLTKRCGTALERLLSDAEARHASNIVLVTHGNVIRALMSHYTSLGIPFRDWLTENCGGWVVDVGRSPVMFEIAEDRRKGWLNS